MELELTDKEEAQARHMVKVMEMVGAPVTIDEARQRVAASKAAAGPDRSAYDRLQSEGYSDKSETNDCMEQ